MQKKYSINFHQTFPMEVKYVSYILGLKEKEEGYTKEEISEITGIPTGKSSGKVVPNIEYAKYCNLITYQYNQGRYKIITTELGKKVLKEDRYLNESLTKELLLYFLTSEEFGADQWYYMLRELFSESPLKKELLENLLKKRYENNNVKNGAIISTVRELNNKILIEENEEYKLKYKKPNRESVFGYAYSLAKEIEVKFHERKEVNINEIRSLKWKEGYFFSENDFQKILEWLEDKNLIRINKQLSPVTILLLKNSKELISLIYSELL
ncbi:MAG: hypothetical protein ACRC0V_02830 [Fusobacteriaceae bacterium]